MKAEVAPENKPEVNTIEIKKLIDNYIRRVKNSNEAYDSFIAQDFTLYAMTIDFGNTIACGGTLQTVLDRYE